MGDIIKHPAKVDKDKRRHADLEQSKKDLIYAIEVADVIAKLRRAQYDAYLRVGFTKAEALELVKKMVPEE
jgi:hypothetical protein